MGSPCRDETRTKVVATIGPASRDAGVLRAMIREGMDVARVNASHGTSAERAADIAAVRRAAAAETATVALLVDLQGPKVRLGALAQPVDFAIGERLSLTADPAADGTGGLFPLPYPELLYGLRAGSHLLFDDGAVEAVVRRVLAGVAEAEIVVGGRLSSHKGVAAPGATARVAALTEKDRTDAIQAVEDGVDYLALSFVQSADDVRALRRVLESLNADVEIVAKIEKREAIDALDEILDVADAVMVARGDLGVDVPPQEVPFYQKEIIHRANRRAIPVITATQMLQSMVSNPRPTRAEASDVANAVLDGTDALLLSAETAAGAYPRESVAMMREISAIAERAMPSRSGDERFREDRHPDPIADAIGAATVRVAEEVGARLIVTSTWSGYTARQIARERPHLPIVALTPSERVAKRLALVWGVSPLLVPEYATADDMLEVASRAVIDGGFAAPGDLCVVSAGFPFGGEGKTNFLKVHRL
ncbi:MAG: pyruvate kinase [Candidatus Bipolaricaulota bacterium]